MCVRSCSRRIETSAASLFDVPRVAVAMTSEWGHERSLQLIDEYQKKRVLWDNSHVHYFAKNKKQEAWEEIANIFNIDAEDVKRKLNSLLGSFRRERSRRRRASATGKGREYVSKWFAFDKLLFLVDSRLDREDANSPNVENGEEIIELPLDSPSFSLTSTVGIDKSISIEPFTNKRVKVESPPSPPLEVEVFDKTHSIGDMIDEFDAIGRNVAAKLRNMKMTQRIVAEKLIHDALFYGQLEKLDDTSCIQVMQMPSTHSFPL